MLSFILGAIAGGVAATYWQRDLNRMRTTGMLELRQRLAHGIETAEGAIVGQVRNLSTSACAFLRRQEADHQVRRSRPGEMATIR
jgi:hypothetical protein